MIRKTSEDRRPRLVSFSGIDGSGKSTQIEALQSWVKAKGLYVHLVTFWDDVARLKGVREASGHALFKGEKGIGSPSKPIGWSLLPASRSSSSALLSSTAYPPHSRRTRQSMPTCGPSVDGR